MAKKKLYLFSLFVATMSVLLSMVVMHHHHMGRICMVVERCQQDGNFNDEHTEHHEKEADSCRVHQLHHFVTGCKIMKGIQKQLVTYKRNDGVELSATIITPPGWTPPWRPDR